ncbi:MULTISPECIES: EboA family metabolite traffic protein [Calothrix]|uniref:EboA family metabolite traffic protein n=2 Tax=Calothrix TaxID=1186 RepID=A0ABR8A2X7_9CYAN|nr:MULTISPECIES: EboA family metabolite traffic protein [Calothrix]MBD2194283.1 EboA family metabolite traffic protein [Calothrix parietina FACHB-288]MBD2229596.1 EboA family metabolite traffic protein [Calothrix anomala FACHB-343]
MSNVKKLIYYWLSQSVSSTALAWLEQKQTEIAEGAPERIFFTAFSAVPRYLGKENLQLTSQDLSKAEDLVPGWFPGDWTVDQAGRTFLLLALPHDRSENYVRSLDKVFSSADMRELVALYQSLPLLPHPELHSQRAAEGIRSNMVNVFNAIALHNPYPADYLDNIAWNQMVLKALFVGSPMHLIYGLDRRANPELARMLVNYAHERWAAKRPVSPELWRPVGKFADSEIIADLAKVFADGDMIEKQAAALACAESSLPAAQELLSLYPQLLSAIQKGELTWSNFNRNRLPVCK